MGIEKNGSKLTKEDTETLLRALANSVNAILEHKPDDAVWILTRLQTNIEANIKGE